MKLWKRTVLLMLVTLLCALIPVGTLSLYITGKRSLNNAAETYGRQLENGKVLLEQFWDNSKYEQMSETGKHQGVIAHAAAYEYAEVEDILKAAEEKGEPPFIFLLDGIEDPHNLGAIIRTANLAGAHGVIIPKRRAVGLTATVARTSAGA